MRPEEILRKSLELIKAKWRTEPNYEYTIDQFKSLRQDMTVQHIQNDLTVNTYETNARISLENGDINNFNQCQIVLKDLYNQGLSGAKQEFAAYRILYSAFYLNSNRGMANLLHELDTECRQDAAVLHANAVRQAVAEGNFHSFFQLHTSAPNMGAYLMDFYTVAMRTRALRIVCRSYRPTISVELVRRQLSFEEEDELYEFLEKAGGVIKEGSDPEVLDTKASEAEFKRIDAESVVEKQF